MSDKTSQHHCSTKSSLFLTKFLCQPPEPQYLCVRAHTHACAQSCPTLRPHGLLCPCQALLQGIFLTQGSSPGLPHCRRILYCLGRQGSPPGGSNWQTLRGIKYMCAVYEGPERITHAFSNLTSSKVFLCYRVPYSRWLFISINSWRKGLWVVHLSMPNGHPDPGPRADFNKCLCDSESLMFYHLMEQVSSTKVCISL